MKKKVWQLGFQLITRILLGGFLILFSLTLIAHFHQPLHTYEKTNVNPIKNQRIVIFGDSVSYGETKRNTISKYSYLPLAAKYLKAKEVRNLSVPGSGIMVNHGEGYTWENVLATIKKHQQAVKDADIVIIAAGRNDTVIPELHDYQLKINLQNDLDLIKKINSKAIIYGILPWDGLAFDANKKISDYQISQNKAGFTLTHVADVLAQVYRANDVYFFDPRKSTEEWQHPTANQFGDGLTHPSDETFKKMAATMINWFTYGNTIKVNRKVVISPQVRLYRTAYDALEKNKSQTKLIREKRTMYCTHNVQYNGKYLATVYQNKSDAKKAKNARYVHLSDLNGTTKNKP